MYIFQHHALCFDAVADNVIGVAPRIPGDNAKECPAKSNEQIESQPDLVLDLHAILFADG